MSRFRGFFNAAGDITNNGTNQYLYDGEGRACASGNGSYGVQYIYDAEGNRVAKGTISRWSCDTTSNGFTQTAGYVVGPSGEHLTEISGTGQWVHTNAYAGGKLIGTYDTAGLHFYIDDPLGTRRAQVSSSGSLENSFISLPFGDKLASSNQNDPTENHFTGKERDAESGLDYFGARYYASSMGRFMSPDPSGLAYADPTNPQSFNLYSYVFNNPLRNIDPSGLTPCSSTQTLNVTLNGTSYGSDPSVNCGLNSLDSLYALERIDSSIAWQLAQKQSASGLGPGSPNVPVPGGNGAGWKWNPDLGNGRGGTYGPDTWDRATQGNPPSVSWDDNPGPKGVDHWDLNHGQKGPQVTDRFDEHGNPLTPEQAHGRPPKNPASMNAAPFSVGTLANLKSGLISVGIGIAIVSAYIYELATQ